MKCIPLCLKEALEELQQYAIGRLNKNLNIKVCKTALSQSLGLMFRRRQNLLMIFPSERKVHLHTFFVFYPLTIVLIDRNHKAVEIKRDLKPFRLWNSAKEGKYLLELTFPRTIPQVGDKVEIR